MFKRFIGEKICEALQDTPVVFLMGPRQAGKTTIVKNIIKNDWLFITFDDITQLNAAIVDPVGFIRNLPLDRLVVLDEIQRVPELFIAIKQSVDEYRIPSRFLLTGSANALLLPQLSDSLAGRMETIQMSPLSEYELLGRTPRFLEQLMLGKVPTTNEIRVRDYLIHRIVSGCFPEPVQRKKENRIRAWYKNYILSLIQKDIHDLGLIDQYDDMKKLLEVLSYYSGKLLNFSEISTRIGLVRQTTKKYISLLEQLFLIKIVSPWHVNAYKRMIKTPKVYVVDTGLICASRNIMTSSLKKYPELYGSLLETFVFNELIKQASFIDEAIRFSHYRDKDKVEVDMIIENGRDEIIAIEVKAAASLSQKNFIGLKRVQEISKDKFKLGILLYDGDHMTPFGEGLFAVPIASLWT